MIPPTLPKPIAAYPAAGHPPRALARCSTPLEAMA